MSFANNTKVAKNTVLLYVRMLLLLAVSLYTSRVVLDVLGVDDYGTYNLVGGFVTLFSIISSALVGVIQRYFNAALGENDAKKFKDIYSLSINILVAFSVLIIIVSETIGLWFVGTKLNIPEGREDTVLIVFQISIFTFIVQLFRIPDNAAIIAHEKMGFYAWISIAEAVLKLLIIYLLRLIDVDKLILYAILYMSTSLIINIVYKVYCRKQFDGCKYQWVWNVKLLKEMLSFSGWTILMRSVQVGRSYGDDFLTNHYYSVSINAARGVSAQVYNTINSFLVNFQTAFKPQLIKTYVAGEMEEHYKMVYRTSKLSFFLLLLLVVPISFNIDVLLSTWLKVVPPYTKQFCIYVLIAYLFDALGASPVTSIYANGNIKGLMILSSLVYIISIVFCFIFLQLGFLPYVVAQITTVVHCILFLIDLYYSKKICGISISTYGNKVLMPVILVSVVSLVIPYLLSAFSSSIIIALGICIIDLIWVVLVVFILGLTKEERSFVLSRIKFKK